MAARSDLTSHNPGMPTVLGVGEERALAEAEGEAVLTVGEVVVACVISCYYFKFSTLIFFLSQGRGGDRGRGRGGARGGMRTGAIATPEGRKITF